MLRPLSGLTLVNPTRAFCAVSRRDGFSSAAASELSGAAAASALPEAAAQGQGNAGMNMYNKGIYIADPYVANTVAEQLRDDIAKDRFILEANPGPGVLTKRLLEMGCNRLHLFEHKCSPFIAGLMKIRDDHPTRVKLVEENMLRMASVACYDVCNNTNRGAGFLADIPRQSWDQEPCATAVVSVPKIIERRFILTLIHAFAGKSMIFSSGRIEVLLFLSSDEYRTMTGGSRRPGPMLFSLFFNHKLLGSVDSDAFKPSHGCRRRSSRHIMNLVRLTPKTDIFERLSEPRRVEEFAFFVMQALRRGATLMYLNELIPDSVRDVLLRTRWSGKELVDLHYETKLSALSPNELLRVFEILSRHPLFPQCPLVSALDSESFVNLKSRNQR